jgi:hypothetical protein
MVLGSWSSRRSKGQSRCGSRLRTVPNPSYANGKLPTDRPKPIMPWLQLDHAINHMGEHINVV